MKNPATTKGLKRQTQTLRCCGHLYRRWRFFDPTRQRQPRFSGIKKCRICGDRLKWPASYFEPDRARTARERMQDRAVSFLLQGLTTHGRPYQRQPNFKIHGEPQLVTGEKHRRLIRIRQRNLANYYRRKKRFIALGLNTRGQSRTYHRGRYSPIAMAYRDFKNETANLCASVSLWQNP
jgi:hypothetical protein